MHVPVLQSLSASISQQLLPAQTHHFAKETLLKGQGRVSRNAKCSRLRAQARSKHSATESQTAAAHAEEDVDELIWEPSGLEVAGDLRAERDLSPPSSSDDDQGVEAAQQYLDDGGWSTSLSPEEQASMDQEASEFAYGFGSNEARDMVAIEAAMDEVQEELDQGEVPELQKLKARKGRRRNDRGAGRPRETTIPLHMLPKVPAHCCVL